MALRNIMIRNRWLGFVAQNFRIRERSPLFQLNPSALMKIHEDYVLLKNVAKYSSAAPPTSETPLYHDSNEEVSLDSEGKLLTVTWKDGSQSRFHSAWLRHNCHCSFCRQEHSGQRVFDPAALPHDICMDNFRVSGDQLEIQWKGESQHNGHIFLTYLQDHCYESHKLQSKRDSVKLGKPLLALPEFPYKDLIETSDGVLRWLQTINADGVCLVKDVPIEDNKVVEVAEYIAAVPDLIYGTIFDVRSNPEPINVAYSSVGLDFHMDLIYYESPPGLQFLHCLRFDDCVEGGESRFVDVFHVAEEFREFHPEHFKTLTRLPATFQKVHYSRDKPVEMRYQRTHIVVNHRQEIVAVNWAPAFEGPLALEQEDVEPYYAAYEAFAKAIKFSPNIVECKLKPGDLVVFNNRRTLHARKSFKLNGGMRHLKGTYMDIDHFKNKLSVLTQLHGSAKPVKRVGNQDWF